YLTGAQSHNRFPANPTGYRWSLVRGEWRVWMHPPLLPITSKGKPKHSQTVFRVRYHRFGASYKSRCIGRQPETTIHDMSRYVGGTTTTMSAGPLLLLLVVAVIGARSIAEALANKEVIYDGYK